jgi:hypothetical protein
MGKCERAEASATQRRSDVPRAGDKKRPQVVSGRTSPERSTGGGWRSRSHTSSSLLLPQLW